jgi:hypothetical protein
MTAIPAASWTRRTAVLGAAIIAVTAAAVTGAAMAGTTNTVYTGCLDHKTHTLYKVKVTSTLPSCRSGDTKVTWSARGPQGPRGPRGVQGKPGLPGDDGQPGEVSITHLGGAACTQANASPGVVQLTQNSDNTITLQCVPAP